MTFVLNEDLEGLRIHAKQTLPSPHEIKTPTEICLLLEK